MKKIEIRRAVENSDGVWRGTGKPVFEGTLADARQYVTEHPPKWPSLAYEYDEVSYKNGREVKRKIRAGLN